MYDRDQIIEVLRCRLDCPVTGPADPGWEEQRRGWNRHVDQHPLAIVEATTTAEIQETVRAAGELQVPVAVQSNGHGATEAMSGTVLIRAHRLRDLTIDIETRRARVGAGVKWEHLVSALAGTGLSGLPGSTHDLTVVGYLIGGGLPWFGRTYGTGASWVRAWELVRPDGELVHITAQSDPDLFWAMGGAGGSFGIVVAVELELLEVPALYGGQLMWPAEAATEVLEAFAQVTAAAPRELTVWLWLITFPPADPFPEELHGRSMVNINITYLGRPAEAEAGLAPLRAVPGLEWDTLAPIGIEELATVANEPTEPLPVLDWSHFVPELSSQFQRRLLQVNPPAPDTPMIACIRHLGGALAEPTPTVSGPFPAEYLLFGFALAEDAEQAEQIRAHWELLERSLGRFLDEYTHMNMLGQNPDVTRAVGPQDLARLRQLKRERDPAGRIRGHRPLVAAPVPVG